MAIWRMRVACWIPKATDTHSEYVTLIGFPPQQWLHERNHCYVTHTLPCLVVFFPVQLSLSVSDSHRLSCMIFQQFPLVFLAFPLFPLRKFRYFDCLNSATATSTTFYFLINGSVPQWYSCICWMPSLTQPHKVIRQMSVLISHFLTTSLPLANFACQ